jgi:uncharacterized protein
LSEISLMESRKLRICWPLALAAAFLASPAFAARIDCSRAPDPAIRTICAHPNILSLDDRVSSAYSAALARNPSRADDLRQDEINWLGERNREIGWLPGDDLDSAPLSGTAEATLAHFYQLRIAFLRNIDNPAATQDAPLARALLESVAALSPGATDPLEALRSAGIVVVADERNASDAEHTIDTLAAPPDAALHAELAPFRSYPYTVEYLPSAGLGGAFTVQGTGDCQSWVLFEKRADATVPVRGSGSLGGCTRDQGATGYLALIRGHPAVLTVTDDPAFRNVTDLQWQEWLGGDKWGPETRIRLRYGYSLEPDRQMYCKSPSAQCTSSMSAALNGPARCPDDFHQCALITTVALGAAKQYLRNALGLAARSGGPASEQARFTALLRLAPGRKDWASCANPVWFPVHLGGKLALGGITESHLGCHPGGGALDVGVWATTGRGARQWWFVDETIKVARQRLLAASVVPPA